MTTSNFNLEKQLIANGYDIIIGIDEAGRGPLAGPVVASAVVLRDNQILNSTEQILSPLWKLVRDSKKLSEKQREKVCAFIGENFHVGIGLVNEKTIDRVNILEATYLAMKKAVSDVKAQMAKDMNLQNKKIIILVDGNKIIPNLSIEQKAITGGDNIAKSISAASIIAKVTRDKMMKEYDKKWPEYKFATHKGYGTKVHMEALKKFGACEIHRRTFAPVRNILAC